MDSTTNKAGREQRNGNGPAETVPAGDEEQTLTRLRPQEEGVGDRQ